MPWAWIKQGLEDVITKTDADWSVEDVYLMLKHKSATLFTLGQEDGFVILQKLQDSRGPYLFVWVMWGRNSLMGDKVGILAKLRELAVSLGCKSIQMKSPRTGWVRLGFRVKEVVYEADIWPEERHG
jgi:hypothetical protein